MVDALTPGEIHRPQHVVAVAGGKALNAARAAHALGADVHAIALLGGHAGRWVAAALEEEGVTCDAVPGPGETRICLSVSDGGALTEFYEPGPALDAEHWDGARGGGRARRGQRARWVGVAGSLPPGAPADAGRAAARAWRARPARASRSTSAARRSGSASRPAPTSSRSTPREAAELGQCAEPRAAAARGRGRRRRRRRRDHPRRRRDGARDARRRACSAPPRRALGAYPVGSGDAALGGFLAALDAGAPWPDALARAAERGRG